MGDCFPKTGGLKYPIPDKCNGKTGFSEYAGSYKQWCNPIASTSLIPEVTSPAQDIWKQRYSFSKGPRFGIPPYCDCTPPTERFRFETTYNHDFTDCVHNVPRETRRNPILEGMRPQSGQFLPKQFLCPFTTETTYARAYDMPQRHFQQICSQNEPCGEGGDGYNQQGCCDDDCESPCGLQISISPNKPRPKWYRLRKECLIKPGTDTSNCERCPRNDPYCNEEEADCHYNPCKLHQAATTPTRRYPCSGRVLKYVPDPREVPFVPKLLCGGGMEDCPEQKQFPTPLAIIQARERLKELLEKERCRYPPECMESLYRSTYKTPPLNDAPKYCSREQVEEAIKAEEDMCKRGGLAPPCIPSYCLDGGKPPGAPDVRPMFDHLSTYEADYVWDNKPRFKTLGGEIPCKFKLKPLCDNVIHYREMFPQRTEEKERWGDNWEICPPPAPETEENGGC